MSEILNTLMQDDCSASKTMRIGATYFERRNVTPNLKKKKAFSRLQRLDVVA